jgi:hypothetical protein
MSIGQLIKAVMQKVAGLMQPLMRNDFKSGIRKELEALKAALEGDSRH